MQIQTLKTGVITTISFAVILAACTNRPTKISSSADTMTIAKANTIAKLPADSSLLQLTKVILAVIKKQDYDSLQSFIHPVEGIRLTPYGYIDTLHDMHFTVTEFQAYLTEANTKKLNWGAYDGSGDTISLTLEEYFTQFVYDVDFLSPEKIALNEVVATGNTRNNIAEIYGDCVFTESYFSGFKSEYAGMDWRSLRLVFKPHGHKFFLVGIVHDQWTT